MPSDFLTPFLELDEEFCKNFRGLETADGLSYQQQQTRQRASVHGFQRRHSLCPVTLPNSKFNSGGSAEVADPDCWGLSVGAPSGQQWWDKEVGQQLPCSSLDRIPFRVDRSVSMIEGHAATAGGLAGGLSSLLPSPPPGLGLSLSNASISSTSFSAAAKQPLAPSPPMSTRYKTELCRTYEESGTCKYGAKCQFAHGFDEMRGLSRHPKYKTEPCRTFHTVGFCPYGARCHFVHNADDMEEGGAAPPQRPPLLRHSVSFAGFSSSPQAFASSFRPVQESQQPPVFSSSFLFTRASSVSPPPSSSEGSPELLSPLFPEPGVLRHCPYPFSGLTDHLAKDAGDGAPCFYASTADPPVGAKFPAFTTTTRRLSSPPGLHHIRHQQNLPLVLSGLQGLQRCSSADSLSEEGYTSSSSLSSSSSSSSGSESPNFEGRRLPIFSSLSVSDD